MTPEERARAVVLPWYRGPYGLHVDTSYQEVEIADIAAAIRAAVEAEREACALMCDEWGQGDCDASISALDFEKKYGDQIDLSAYIRARS